MVRVGDITPSHATTRSESSVVRPVGALDLDADDAVVAVADEVDDRVLVDDRQVAGEGLDERAEADGDRDAAAGRRAAAIGRPAARTSSKTPTSLRGS